MLEPECAEKPKKENIESLVISAIEKWHEIPIFNLDLGKIITRLRDEFSVRDKINLRELRQILQELGLGMDYIPKLRSFLVIKDDLVEKSPIFDRLVGFWQKLDEIGIKNFTDWKKWVDERVILSEIEVFSQTF